MQLVTVAVHLPREKSQPVTYPQSHQHPITTRPRTLSVLGSNVRVLVSLFSPPTIDTDGTNPSPSVIWVLSYHIISSLLIQYHRRPRSLRRRWCSGNRTSCSSSLGSKHLVRRCNDTLQGGTERGVGFYQSIQPYEAHSIYQICNLRSGKIVPSGQIQLSLTSIMEHSQWQTDSNDPTTIFRQRRTRRAAEGIHQKGKCIRKPRKTSIANTPHNTMR